MATVTPVDFTSGSRPSTYSHDIDVFRAEPLAYDMLADATLLSATDGSISGATLTSAGSNFTNAGIQAGDVGRITIAAEGNPLFWVYAIPSSTTLTIYRLGASAGYGQSFGTVSSRPFTIRTFDHWRERAWYEIGVHRLGLDDPNKAITTTITTDDANNTYRPRSLRDCEVALTLAYFFESRSADDPDGVWRAKADKYMERFNELILTAKVILQDSSGSPDKEISVGNTSLERV